MNTRILIIIFLSEIEYDKTIYTKTNDKWDEEYK